VAKAKPHYHITAPQDNDIVIANAYCKEDEAYHAYNTGREYVSRKGGDIVLIHNTILGLVAHYMSGSFGRSIGGRGQGYMNVPEWLNHLVLYSEFPEARTLDRIPQKDQAKALLLRDWTDVVMALQKWHGDKAKVAVFPDGTIQSAI